MDTMDPFPFFAVVGGFILLGLLEAFIDWRRERRDVSLSDSTLEQPVIK